MSDATVDQPFGKPETRDFFIKLIDMLGKSVQEMNSLSLKQLQELRNIRDSMDKTHHVTGKLIDAMEELTHELKQARKEGKNGKGSPAGRVLRRG